MKNSKIYSLLLLFIITILPIYGQEYIFDAQLLTTEDGLANSMTSTIIQDSKGFIWIGTKYGLNRYDGYSFEHYNSENNGLKVNDRINALFEDEKGNIWLHYVEAEGNHFCDVFNPLTKQAVALEAYFEYQLPFDIADIYGMTKVDSKNIISICTKKGELYFYEENQFKKIAEGLPFGSDYGRFYVVFDDKDIWVAFKSNLMRINSSGELLEIVSPPNYTHYFGIGRDGQLWANQFQEETEKTILQIKKKSQSQFEPFFLKKDSVYLTNLRRTILGKNNLWYAIFEEELHVFDIKGAWLFNLNSLFDYSAGVHIRGYLESDDKVWFTTSSGVIKTNTKQSLFRLIQGHTKIQDYRGITEDEAGNIYFLNRGLFRWNPLTGQLHQYQNHKGTLDIIYDDNIIWSSIYDNNILGFQFDLKTGKSIKYNHTKAKYAFTSIATSTPKQYLIGHIGGLSYLDLSQQTVLPFEQYNNFEVLKSLEVYHLHRNDSGIWLATNRGIFLMTEDQGIIQHFDQASGHLPFGPIIHIHEDESGVFWLASGGGGLIQWTPVLDSALPSQNKQMKTEDGLSHNYLYAVYGDNHNRLWIPSDNGLMVMDKNTFEFHTYTTEDGLPNNEFNTTSHHQSKDGTLYFGGLGGIITFHPDSIPINPAYDAPMEFVGYQLLKEGDSEPTDLTSTLTESNKIVVVASDKLFELTFALLDFDDPDNHRYTYQIEGFDNNWHPIEENFLRITHLPYGNYTLKIKGQNIKKGWSKQELKLKIQVLKPFYLRWWFWVFTLASIIGLTAFIIKWRLEELNKNRRYLELEVQKRTKQIERDKKQLANQAEKLTQLDELKNRFFTNITHEFRTPLTLIIGPIEQMLKQIPPPNVFQKSMKGILKNSYLILNTINQLLELTKIEDGKIKLQTNRGDIIEMTRDIIERFRPFAKQKKQIIIFLPLQKSWVTNFDADKWNKILYNLLVNAIKFTPKMGIIKVNLSKYKHKNKTFIQLAVKDTGAGIPEKELTNIFKHFYQIEGTVIQQKTGSGIGLSLVKELVELQQGKISVSSELGKGTSFNICLPVLAVDTRNLLPIPLDKPINLNPILEEANFTPDESAVQKEKLDLLIVEDIQEVREYIRYCIDDTHYNIYEASDGAQGIQKAIALIPDLIISDVMMPKKDGFQLTQAIRTTASTSHIPIILLTAKATLENRLEGLKRGADAYLTKPFNPEELTIRIKKLISIRILLQQHYQNGLSLPEKSNYPQEDAFIKALEAYVLEHLDDAKMNGDQIGKHLLMSRIHLYRKLKALTGQSITEYVRVIRLNKSLELLKENKWNVSEIAYQTGFSSISYFSRCFKNQFGKTPREIQQNKLISKGQ